MRTEMALNCTPPRQKWQKVGRPAYLYRLLLQSLLSIHKHYYHLFHILRRQKVQNKNKVMHAWYCIIFKVEFRMDSIKPSVKKKIAFIT